MRTILFYFKILSLALSTAFGLPSRGKLDPITMLTIRWRLFKSTYLFYLEVARMSPSERSKMLEQLESGTIL